MYRALFVTFAFHSIGILHVYVHLPYIFLPSLTLCLSSLVQRGIKVTRSHSLAAAKVEHYFVLASSFLARIRLVQVEQAYVER